MTVSTRNTPVKTSLLKGGGTVFNINFDFNSAEQKTILEQLQKAGYSLFGYKGASGPEQIDSGLPTWFKVPFLEMFGNVDIDYEPVYKVYAFNKASIGTNTIIRMEVLSEELTLGTEVQFNPDGSFSTLGPAKEGTISVLNTRPEGTSDITIGLAAKVNGIYQPFCAFTCTPQGSVNMEPNEKICLFAAKSNIVSGSVIGNAAAPGCTFNFNSQNIIYDLDMIPSTYGITSAPGGNPVNAVKSNESLIQLLG